MSIHLDNTEQRHALNKTVTVTVIITISPF